VSGQLHVPAALSPGKKPPVPIGKEAGWSPEPVWMTWRRGNSWPYRNSNSDPSFVQLVASRYTDWATPAPKISWVERHTIFHIHFPCAVPATSHLCTYKPYCSWRRMGEWRYSSTIILLGIRCDWVVTFALRPLYLRGKSTRYSLERRLGGPQSTNITLISTFGIYC
jgi:hypothetical protein